MREIVRTNDPVLLSFLESLFREANMRFIVADVYMSVVEGSIGAFPRRFMVLDGDETAARQLVADAGLAHELVLDVRGTGNATAPDVTDPDLLPKGNR